MSDEEKPVPYPDDACFSTSDNVAECLDYGKFLPDGYGAEEIASIEGVTKPWHVLCRKLWSFTYADTYRVTATHVDGCHEIAAGLTKDEAQAVIEERIGRKLDEEMGEFTGYGFRAVDNFGGVQAADKSEEGCMEANWGKLTRVEQIAIIKAYNDECWTDDIEVPNE